MKYRLHGANYEKLYKDFNIKIPNKVIDFSTNTNIFSKHIDNVDLNKLACTYPDDESIKVKKIISEKCNVSIDNILVTNGSNEAIYMIASLLANKEASIMQPTYPEYEKALKSYNVKIHHNYNLNSIDSCSAIFLCNPNNPTGSYIAKDELESFIEKNSEKEIIIDEAYVDFLSFEHNSININEYRNVYILRSLTKSYNLSGIRIGYVISSVHNINKLKKRQPTWSVNSVAQQLATLYLEDNELIKKTKYYYKNESSRVISKLREINYVLHNTAVIFFLLKTYKSISQLLEKTNLHKQTHFLQKDRIYCLTKYASHV
jgi:threonine-phosphate decarboxylase